MNTGEGNKDNFFDNNLLVLSLDADGKIVFFNRELEKQVGYYKNDVVDKETFDLFLPEEYKKDFYKIIDKAKKDNIVTDLYLPLMNKNGKKIMTSWDVAPVDDTNLGSIGFVGRILNEKNFEKDDSNSSDKMIFNLGNKKIFFKNSLFSSKNKNIPVSNEQERKKNKNNSDTKIPLDEYDSTKLKENVKIFEKKIEYLDILEKENLELKKKLKDLENELSKNKEKIKYLEEKQSSLIKNSQNIVKNTVGFIFDVVGGKKKKEEFEQMMNELDERRETLKNLEENLNEEKSYLNDDVKDFVEWRKKLETLEDEVEQRREFLVNREQKVKSNILSYVDEGVSKKKEKVSNKNIEQAPSDLIDTLDDAAVILQRGILKHANNKFTDFIGLDAEEIIDKSFFDFISSDGLSSFEKYYLDRLKGETAEYYDTVFVNADDSELPVKVDIKPVFYNGSLVDKLIILEGSDDVDNTKNSEISDSDSSKLSQDQINEMKNEDIDNKPDDKTQNSNSEKNGSSAAKMSQDDISAMFAKERGEKIETKPKKSVGGVPGVVTQDQIDDMVKKAQKETNSNVGEDQKDKPIENQPSESEKSEKEPSEGKMSQDEINAMLAQSKNKGEKAKSDTDEDAVEESDNSNASSGGKMNQDDISAMFDKTRSEKKEKKQS
jgi:PAS domain S-box-containing protein